MKSPYIFYPIIILWLFVIAVDLAIVFDGFDRVRVGRLRGSRNQTRGRKRENEYTEE